jgi:transcriptional regulator GlxA family with amidase domain
VQWAINLLKADPARKFRVSELAHAVNLSTWHFSHLFLKETQASPHQFVRRLRFERARILLEGSFSSIKEIMAAVGVNDKSHFAKDFKKLYGLSPIQYRHKYASTRLTKRAAS